MNHETSEYTRSYLINIRSLDELMPKGLVKAYEFIGSYYTLTLSERLHMILVCI